MREVVKSRLQQGVFPVHIDHKILSSLESEFGNERQSVNNGTYFISDADHFNELCVNSKTSDGTVKEDSATENLDEKITTNHVDGHFKQNSTFSQIQAFKISKSENQNFLLANS